MWIIKWKSLWAQFACVYPTVSCCVKALFVLPHAEGNACQKVSPYWIYNQQEKTGIKYSVLYKKTKAVLLLLSLLCIPLSAQIQSLTHTKCWSCHLHQLSLVFLISYHHHTVRPFGRKAKTTTSVWTKLSSQSQCSWQLDKETKSLLILRRFS